MKRSGRPSNITPLVLSASLVLAGCQGLNQKISQFDSAADKAVVDNVDNSRLNQSINSGLNKAGKAVTGMLPGAMRPPSERLSTNEPVAAGETPDPLPVGGRPSPLPAQPEPVQAQPPQVHAAIDSERPRTTGAGESPLALTEMRVAGVTLKRSNIRMGPGLDHDVIDTVAPGTPLTISGRTRDGWLLVDRAGQAFGFVSAGLVRLAD